MKLEVLLSTMNQTSTSFIEKMNTNSDVLVVNQCDKYDYSEEHYKNKLIRMISNTNRGLSRSRNEALLNATGDICVLCDDDVVYKDDYVDVILEAFNKIKDADIIVFNTNKLNCSSVMSRKKITKIRKAPRYKTYGSVRLAFNLKSLQKKNIWFDVNFGAGSTYGAGEESLVLREARKRGLKIYEHPAFIADVDYATSSWFDGYSEKFFFDKGAWLAAAYPCFKYFFVYYYILKFRKHSTNRIGKLLREGIKSYKNNISFDEWKVLQNEDK